MFEFFVVTARLFLVFCVCPKFYDLAKQRRKFGPVTPLVSLSTPMGFAALEVVTPCLG